MLRSLCAGLVAGFMIAAPLALTQNAAAQDTKTDAKTEKKTEKTKAKRPMSPAQQALHERQKKCGAEWKAAKAAGKIEKGAKWPQYWSACNKRLKAGG